MTWWLDITDLDDDQKDVIALPAAGRYLILGPPGSGKTNLLLIRAEYLMRTGAPNLFLLMFNDALHDFVIRGGSHYQVPEAKIRKIMSWEMALLREHDVPVDDLPDDDLPEKRKQLAIRVLSLLDENPSLEGHLQCLLVDEVQDCLAEEIEVFLRCAANVCFAGDSSQRIFNAKNIITQVKSRLHTIELKTHYRLGHEICQVADVIGKAAGLSQIEPNCNYRGPTSEVHFLPCGNDDEQVEKIIETLSVQLTAYPEELLGVFAPRKQDRDFLRACLESSGLRPFILPHRQAGGDDPKQQIYIAHLLDIKGLEFRAVHLGLMQHLYKLGQNQKRIAYTAVTRGKTTVRIYYTGGIPGYMEEAKASVEPPVPTPPLADLFPNRRGKA